jgi:L,D-transpeptidase YbiS
MRSKSATVLIIAFSVLLLAMAELLYPLKDSLRVDMVADVIALFGEQGRIRSSQQRLDSALVEIRALGDSLARAAVKPSRAEQDSLYLVVDTHTNQLFVRRGDALLRSCAATTGKNAGLSGGGQRWFFSTPRGIMTVRDKRVDPVWIKPDWAFVEEGVPIPPLNSPERLVQGHLGEYALILGGGIMIHGTTDASSLGRNASHGCIRLGREDLRYVYAISDVGTRVYIF